MKIDPNKKIEVYFNLHKKTWSVRQSGRVVGHTNYIQVKNPQYVVSQKGNERVRREKKKNVHAFVKGLLCNPREQWSNRLPYHYDEVTYNPYKYDSFVFADTRKPIFHAKFVDMDIGPCAGPQVMVQFAA